MRVGSLKVDVDEGRAELDSHADTTVLSESLALITYDYGRPVRVHGYDESVAQRDSCKTVSAVMAYDHPTTGTTYYLVFNQAILIPCLKVALISPMQLRDNDVLVNDEPKSMALNPTDDHHTIIVPDPSGGDEPVLRIPLWLHGVTSHFNTRKPSKEEYDSSDPDMHVHMTYDSPEWDPSDERFAVQEAAMADDDGMLL